MIYYYNNYNYIASCRTQEYNFLFFLHNVVWEQSTIPIAFPPPPFQKSRARHCSIRISNVYYIVTGRHESFRRRSGVSVCELALRKHIRTVVLQWLREHWFVGGSTAATARRDVVSTSAQPSAAAVILLYSLPDALFALRPAGRARVRHQHCRARSASADNLARIDIATTAAGQNAPTLYYIIMICAHII